MEIWKDIFGYEGKYQISNLGNVKSLKRKNNLHEKILSNWIDAYGYFMVTLVGEKSSRKNKRVHRLMAIAFIENVNNKPCINHKNAIKSDNSIENLEWCTYGENIKHVYSLGLNTGMLGKQNFGRRKPVNQIDINGNIIKKFDCALFASRELNISTAHISNVCNKNRKSKYGFSFEFAT